VIFAVLQNGVQLLGINQFWLEAVTGAAILGTVIFYNLLTRRAERAEREARYRAGGVGLASGKTAGP
jgi:rhamnose transport system permease protein